jgi:hypothetical protein
VGLTLPPSAIGFEEVVGLDDLRFAVANAEGSVRWFDEERESENTPALPLSGSCRRLGTSGRCSPSGVFTTRRGKIILEPLLQSTREGPTESNSSWKRPAASSETNAQAEYSKLIGQMDQLAADLRADEMAGDPLGQGPDRGRA